MNDEGRVDVRRQPLYVSGQCLSEESLQEIGRGLSNKFPTAHDTSTESVTHLDGVLKAILHTAQSAHISQSHRAAACNALTAFLEKCRSSPVIGLQSLCRPDYLWTDIFNFYLERSDKAKIKPMRQVLVALASIILRDSDSRGARRVLDAAVTRAIAIIFKQEAYNRVKPALQALDYFISKRVVLLKDLVRLVHAWLSNSGAGTADGNSVMSLIHDTIPTDEAPNHIETETSSDHVERIYYHYIKVLASAILYWMPEPDIAPAAGDLFITLFSTLKKGLEKGIPHQVADTAIPIWCGPLQASIEKSPDALGGIRQHIFPSLFKLNVADFRCFLEHLRIKNILSEATLADGDTLVMTLFIALQVGKEIGLVRGSDDGPLGCNVVHADAVVIPDALIGSLLARASATIRLAALSLLVASPLTTRPFSFGALFLLEQNMAFFHADTDAKFRTDVLSTTKRLVDRLRGSISSLSREAGRYRKVKAHQDLHGKVGSHILEESREQREAAEASKCPIGRLQRHVEFLNWYISFLITELQPTASYQRHVTALKALNILLQSGLDGEVPALRLSKLAQGEIKWPFHVKVLDTRTCRVLLDLLADPFDDVRSGAASILKMVATDLVHSSESTSINFCPQGRQIDSKQKPDIVQDATGNTTSLDIFGFLDRLEHTMHLSGRADHADGVARAYEIIFDVNSRYRSTTAPLRSFVNSQHGNTQLSVVNHLMSALEEGLDDARKDLPFAVSNSPVHGYLAGIRLILDRTHFYHTLLSLDKDSIRSWKQLHQRIIKFCQNIWECIKGSLCSDSPEGYIPEEFEDEGDLGTKDILSYSWRAIKESSATLRTIASNATYDPQSEFSILDESDLRAIGQLSFTQLAELRHRGAFSTVSLTFAACCQRCFRERSMNQLPNVWYENTLDCIRDQASTTTRRSAGIPSLITGIMASNPGGPLFVQVITDLLAEARLPLDTSSEGQVKLPQVHALNCLKDAFANSRLGPCSEPYLAETMELSVKCLGSEVWAIRNCGIMLFRALADRLFGTNESRNKGDVELDNRVPKLSYDKYPNLPGLLKKLLDQPRVCSSSPTGSEYQAASAVHGFGSPEAVFPAMDIIRRAGSPKTNDAELRGSILFHLGSKIWHVRDMAARTFCSLINRREFIEEVSYFISLPWMSNNAFHGRLLGIRYLLQTYLPQDPNRMRDAIQRLIPLFQNLSSAISGANICPVIKGAFFEAINVILESCIRVHRVDSTTDCPLSRSINQLCEDMGFSRFLDILLALLKNLGDQGSQYGSSSLYRRALVRGTILHHCLRRQISDLQPVMESLAKCDPDTLSDSIELLESLYPTEPNSAPTDTFLGIASILLPALGISPSPEVKARIANYIAELCESSPSLAPRLFTASQKDIADVLPVSSFMLGNASGLFSSPSLVNAGLRLWGSIFAARCTQQPTWSDSLTRMLGAWTAALHEAGEESNVRHSATPHLGLRYANVDQDFATRMAAVMSLRAFKRAFRVPGQDPYAKTPLLGAYVALYDTLNDDDDEIRDTGATVVSWIISPSSDVTPGLSLLPLAAGLRFSEWLSSQYSHSTDLFTIAVQRLTLHPRWLSLSATGGTARTLEPAESLLTKAAMEDRSLFVKEKQNLFIDEAREADIWSQVLLRVAREASHEQLAKAYIAWVKRGLIALSDKARVEATDGPLGWTAKPEVFAIGLHVILGAKVVLKWMKDDGLHDEKEMVITALNNLAEIGRQTSLHELWLSRVGLITAQHC